LAGLFLFESFSNLPEVFKTKKTTKLSDLKLCILGNGSAVPTSSSNPSGQILNYKGSQFMFDCGEGTQMQMIKYKIKHRKLDHIFISHLHGDHFYGLIGLISTFHLFGRDRKLTVYAPQELEKLSREQLSISNTSLRFELEFVHLEKMNDKILCDGDDFEIKSFPLKHSVPSWGFVFKQKPTARRIKKDFVQQKKLKPKQIVAIKNGADFTDEKGVFFANTEITKPPKTVLSYAYCSDTSYYEPVIESVKGVTLLYHEATFNNAMLEVAIEKQHSTAQQAAEIAKKAGVSKLLLGHFSARFNDLSVLEQEAQSVFPNSYLSREGETYEIK